MGYVHFKEEQQGKEKLEGKIALITAAPAELVLQSLASARTERTGTHTRKVTMRPRPSVKEMERAGRKAIAIQADARRCRRVKPRSKRGGTFANLR